ncbi:MAG TPA: MFS transporter [Deltaproteobacteria bacterium]|nr:MFS transporter [Deltaproteobacteria bacterium]
MLPTLLSFAALFTAVFSLMMGIGLLGTHLSLRMTIEGFSTQVTGLILSGYFFGLVSGSFLCHRLIQQVGHIRSFAAFAAVTTAIVMLHGLYISAIAWGILRFLTGMATMGLYMVIESWLNECTVPEKRGRIFSIYMVLAYLGIGIGQQLLNVGDVRGQSLFFVVGLLLVLCLVPVAVTRSIHPQLPETTRFNLIALFKRAPMGMLGCLIAGLINSAFYSMGPVFGNQIGLNVSDLSWFMTATILGGILFQWPVGIIADRFDRGYVLSILEALITIISILILLSAGGPFIRLLVAMGIFGGLIFTIYPVSVARTHDLFEAKDIIPVSSALLLSYGIGASIGPIAASGFMGLSKSPYGFFIYCALVSGMFAIAGYYLRRKEKISVVPVEEHVNFRPMRSTSPVAMVIDPRVEDERSSVSRQVEKSVNPGSPSIPHLKPHLMRVSKTRKRHR